jgi:phage gp16-like protein
MISKDEGLNLRRECATYIRWTIKITESHVLKTNTRNLILEVKTSSRQCTLESLVQIKEFFSLRYGLKPPAITYSIEPIIAV